MYLCDLQKYSTLLSQAVDLGFDAEFAFDVFKVSSKAIVEQGWGTVI